MAIIEVNHVSKEYRLGHLQTFKQSLQNGLARLRGLPPVKRELFKALNDVDFRIEKGEVVGVIGTNGAGKSTLLKILSGITQPTQGQVKVQGKVAPLIEVGAGLNPELTGRENIYLNGAILGIPRKEIQKKMDKIVEFAELEQFIDTPVKRYSSGMKVRLGFSIATSVDADILIIDEVLAVGDLAFQRKCFDRMEELIKRQGKTVLLVSHNIRQVERLCSRVILMNSGCFKLDADPQSVCSAFYNASNDKIHEQYKHNKLTFNAERSGEVEVDNILLHTDGKKNSVNEIEMHKSLDITVDLTANKDFDNLEVILGIHTTDFVYLFSATSTKNYPALSVEKGKHSVICHFQDLMLAPGVYSLRLAIRNSMGAMLWYGENIHPFKVKSGVEGMSMIPKLGLLDVPYEWYLSSKKDTPITSNLVALNSGKRSAS